MFGFLKRKKSLPAYDVLAALFVTTLIVSNIASTKIVAVGPLVLDAGTVLFPLAYIAGDIITEVYGFRRMRRLIAISVAMMLLASATFWLVQVLPANADWTNQAAYDSTLGVVWRIVAASLVALFFGEILNAYVMARAKVQTKGHGLWLRMIGSSVVGSAVDTVLFSTVAFAGTMSPGSLLTLIATVFALKIAVEIIVSPLTLRLIAIIKKREKTDVYEMPARLLVD